MKILLATIDKENASLNSEPSKYFGRAKSYVLYDTCDNEYYVIRNKFYRSNHILAKDVKNLGVSAVVAENICRHCYVNLKKFDIEVWHDSGSITTRESAQKFLLGGLFVMSTPFLEMHKVLETDFKEGRSLNTIKT